MRATSACSNTRRCDTFLNEARDGIAQTPGPHLEDVIPRIRAVLTVAGHNLGVLSRKAIHQSTTRGIERLSDSSCTGPACPTPVEQCRKAEGPPLKVLGIPTPASRSRRSPRTQERPRWASVGLRKAMPFRRLVWSYGDLKLRGWAPPESMAGTVFPSVIHRLFRMLSSERRIDPIGR